jgi:hypothetical protein
MKYRLLLFLLFPTIMIACFVLVFLMPVTYIITGDGNEWMNKLEEFTLKLRNKGKKV